MVPVRAYLTARILLQYEMLKISNAIKLKLFHETKAIFVGTSFLYTVHVRHTTRKLVWKIMILRSSFNNTIINLQNIIHNVLMSGSK